MAVGPTQTTREKQTQMMMEDEDYDKIKDSQMKSLEQLEHDPKGRERGESTMTDAELIALMNQKDDNNFMNNPFFYLIFIWLFAGIGGGVGGFGGGKAAAVEAIGNDFLFQTGQFNNLAQGIQAGFSEAAKCCCETNRNIDSVKYDMSQNFAAMSREMCECCCGINRNVDALSNQLTMSTAAIQQAICDDGRATRDLITQTTIQELRDNLQSANLALANQAQTQTIVSQILTHIPCPIVTGA